MKKNLFFTLILALGLVFTTNTPVFAEESTDDGIMPINESPSHEGSSSASSGSVGTGVNTDDVDQNSNAVECLEENCPDADDIEHNGLSGEPEVVCADENEPDCNNSNDTSEDESTNEETELWPVYVSLGALGGMILLVIIINLLGSRKRKK